MATLGTTNISMSAVRTLLGESSWTLSGLCTSANINKWAKYKPVRGTYPASSNYTYGIDVEDDWAYLQPNSVYRLGDFRQYNHSALPPIKLTMYPDSTQLNEEDLNFAITISEDDLSLEDLGIDYVDPEGYYFCIKSPTGEGGSYYVADAPLGEAYGDLVSIPKSTSGTYTWEALITTNSSGGPGVLLPDDVSGYVNSGTCELTLEPPAVYTIDNVPNLSGLFLIDGTGTKILLTKVGTFVGTVYIYDESNTLVGSYNFDDADPEENVDVGIAAPTGWGSSKTLRIED